MPNTVPLTAWGTDEKNTVTPGVTGAYRVFANALAREREPKAFVQKPPAMRVRLKLKQRNILSGILVSVQATK